MDVVRPGLETSGGQGIEKGGLDSSEEVFSGYDLYERELGPSNDKKGIN